MSLQGLPVMTLASFEEILFTVSSLAMKGCLLLGELPGWLPETEVGTNVSLINFQYAVSLLNTIAFVRLK